MQNLPTDTLIPFTGTLLKKYPDSTKDILTYIIQKAKRLAVKEPKPPQRPTYVVQLDDIELTRHHTSIDVPDDVLQETLLFTGQKVSGHFKINAQPNSAPIASCIHPVYNQETPKATSLGLLTQN